MPSYTHVSSGTPYTVNGAGVLTPTGSSVVAGNLLLLVTGVRAASQTVTSEPTGWTQLTLQSTNTTIAVYARIATGTADDAPSITWSGTSYRYGWIEQFSGDVYTDLTTVLLGSVATEGGSTETTLLAPSFSAPSANNALLILFSAKTKTATGNGSTFTPPGSFTERRELAEDGTRVCAGFASWQQTTAASHDGTNWTKDTGTNESLPARAVILALKTANAAPTFTTPATVTSQTDTAYTLSFTPDSAATIYGVAVVAGSAAPSIAQIKLGQNAASGTAKAANSKAVTGADTLVLTPTDSPAFPRYDLYCVLSNGGGDSARRTLASEYLDAPTGKSFTTLTSLDTTSPFYGTGAAIGDTVVVDTATDPDAYVVTVAVDGTVSYAAGGDTSRQLVSADVYDYSAGAYLGAGELVFNNLAPDPGGQAFSEPLLYQKSVAITSLDLLALAPDPEGDTVVATALDALPTGLSVGSSALTGTPSAYGTAYVEFQWEDEYGATYDEIATIQIGDLVPDVVGDAQATAISSIEAVASLTTSVSTASSPTVASGDVISTDPVAGTLVAPDAVIALLVSSGSALTITTTTLANGTRDVAYTATLAANGAVTSWSVDAGNLPTGLTLDNSTGVISGTPTVAGTYAFTIGATNGVASDTQALTLTIAGIAPSITTTTLTRAIQGVPYSAQIAATGDATITFSLTGLLPAGLSLSESGAITGTPTEAGGSAFTVTATNSEGSDTQALGLSVVSPDTDYLFTIRPRRNRIKLRRQ